MKPSAEYSKRQIGAFLEIDLATDKVVRILICGQNDAEASAIINTIQRITRPSIWAWVRRLLSR